MIISPEIKARIKAEFEAWRYNKDEAKELNSSNTQVVKSLADSLQIKASAIRALFRAMKKLNDSGEDELEVVTTLFEEVRS